MKNVAVLERVDRFGASGYVVLCTDITINPFQCKNKAQCILVQTEGSVLLQPEIKQ